MDARVAVTELHDRLVENYAANPTEQGRQLIAIAEIALLGHSQCSAFEPTLASGLEKCVACGLTRKEHGEQL